MMLTKKDNVEAVEKFSEQLEIEGRSLWQDAGIRFKRNKAAMISLAILSCITLAVIFGPMFSSYAFDDTDWYALHVAPSLGAEGHFFGTDSLGRDLYTRTLMGRSNFLDGGNSWCLGRRCDWHLVWRDFRFHRWSNRPRNDAYSGNPLLYSVHVLRDRAGYLFRPKYHADLCRYRGGNFMARYGTYRPRADIVTAEQGVH